MNYHDEIHATATANGCKPRWYDGIFGWAWHCTCKDMTHACDQQCSMIDPKSARRRRKKP